MQSMQWLRSSICASSLIAICLSGGIARADEFSYSGDHGPGFWGETPGWEACARSTEPGARQTPIDIRETVADPRLQPLALNISAAEISLINNGHTIEQEYENGSQLVLAGAVYELQQFHFHSLSEHVIKGHRGVMEMHAVFKNMADNTMAVIAVIFEFGKSSRFLDRLIDAGLPKKSGDVTHSTHAIDLADGLTDTNAYYTYAGSLTTPPCSETVRWFVLKHPETLSREQFESFNSILGDNFRPLQDRNGRIVRSTVPDKDH
ncbi:MAG: carbonic anhydrase [Povalibacter sp.]